MKTKNIMFYLVSLSLFALFNTTPVFAGYGTAPQQTHEAPKCSDQAPGRPNISYVQKISDSQVEIGWNGVDRASSWTLAYGNESGKYIYGIVNFGDNKSRSVVVSSLPQGTYYAVIKANNGCMPGNFSPEQQITIGKNGTVTNKKTVKKISIFKKLTLKPSPTSNVTQTPTVTTAPTITVEDVKPEVPTEKRKGLMERIFRSIFGN